MYSRRSATWRSVLRSREVSKAGTISTVAGTVPTAGPTLHCGYGGDHSTCTNDAIGDDGSYGPDEGGDKGVFFFTTAGTLVETDQPFMVSSQPIKIYAAVPQLDAPAGKQ